jgi:hypothetical protein
MSGAPGQDEVIEDFLEGQPRASYWRELRDTLRGRLNDAEAELKEIPVGDPNRPALEKRIEDLQEQVAALATEEAVTQFVEDSVRSSLSRPRRPGDHLDFEDDEGY